VVDVLNRLISSKELRLFAHHCRPFYFSFTSSPDSAAYMSSDAGLFASAAKDSVHPLSLQSSLRSLAHLHHLRIRISSFHTLISFTVASASLSPLVRSDPVSTKARQERQDRPGRFIKTCCTTSTGGVEPFFRGLWAVLRTQSRGDGKRGGAGERRVVWDIDDAVFLESG
jgi:hypothetical protein